MAARTWSSQMNQPTAEIYGVWLDDAVSVQALRRAAGQHDGDHLEPGGSDEPRRLATSVRAARPGRSCRIRSNPDIVYGSCKGQYGVMILKTGQEKNYWIGAQSLYGNPARGPDLPDAARVADGDLAARSRRPLLRLAVLHRTRDKGVTWERISPDLTAHPDCCQGAQRRADHARRDGRRVLQHALRDRRIAARARA